ncbi:MAG: hypothetical protein K2Z81_22800, partial [Cyanobacteria bacterium]|nr:hypothetical protein [Cyanobacteriota bacterium]
ETGTKATGSESETDTESLDMPDPYNINQVVSEVIKDLKAQESMTAAYATATPAATDTVAMPKEGDGQPEGPVKLAQMRFSEKDAAEAVELARQNNLPVIVYTGATWCPACPAASANFNNIAAGMAGADETPAVVIKLDSDNAQALAGRGGENGELLRTLLSHGSRIPRMAVYNSSDMSSPVASSIVAGWPEQSMTGFIDGAIESISGAKPDTSEPRLASSFNENNIRQAAELAARTGRPLLTFVEPDNNTDPNVAKAFKYLNDAGLAVAVNIAQPHAQQLRSAGLESHHFNALGSAIKHAGGQSAHPYFSAFNPGDIKADMKFQPRASIGQQSVDDVINFMKSNGVKLTAGHETAVRALLEGKPVPEPTADTVPPADTAPSTGPADATPPVTEEEAESDQVSDQPLVPKEGTDNVFEVTTAEQAKKVFELAKEKGLPVLVHADTAICNDSGCKMEELDPVAIRALQGQAIFMEIPRGGFDPANVNGDEIMEQINTLFAVSLQDHKTQLDVQAFSYNEETEQFERHESDRKQAGGLGLGLKMDVDMGMGTGMTEYLLQLIRRRHDEP